MYPNNNPQINRRPLILAGLGILAAIIIVIAVVSRLSNPTTITVKTANGAANTEYTYTFNESGANKVKLVNTKDATVTKRLPKAVFEVTITQGQKNYYAIADTTKGNVTINAPLANEKKRTYIADNPGSCITLLQNVALSSGCRNDLSKEYKLHVPATGKTPTFVSSLKFELGFMEDSVVTGEGDLVLFAKTGGADENEDFALSHTIYRYTMNGTAIVPGDRAVLRELSPADIYSLIPYRSGFLAYNKNFDDLWYYSSIRAVGQKITLEKPTHEATTPHSVSTADDGSVALVYEPLIDSGEVGTGNTKFTDETEVIIYKDGKTKRFSSKDQFTDIRLCGAGRLCLMNNSRSVLEIRDASTFATLIEMPNVSFFAPYSKGVYISNTKGVLALDTNKMTGTYEYMFYKNTYCGIDAADKGFTLCVTDSRSKKALLRIDESADDKDSIDHKINDLNDMAEIHSISVNNKVVYVIPKGEYVYNGSLNANVADPASTASTAKKINSAIDATGLDRKAYTVVVTPPAGN